MSAMSDGEAITAEGLEALKAELARLEGDARRDIAKRIQAARELGDLKENTLYHIAKEDQAHLETKIARLVRRARRIYVSRCAWSSLAMWYSAFSLRSPQLARGLDALWRCRAARRPPGRASSALRAFEALRGDRFSVAHRAHCGGPAAAAACTSASQGRSPKPWSHQVVPAPASSCRRDGSGRSWLTTTTS